MTWTDTQTYQMYLNLLNAAVLLYGGIVDYKKREIPNLVPIVLALTAIGQSRMIIFQIGCMAIVAVILWFASIISKTTIPGGDVKLICAMTLSTGLSVTSVVLLIAGLESVAAGVFVGKAFKRNIPLCTYVASAYALFCFLLFQNFAYFSSFLVVSVVLVWLTKGVNNKNQQLMNQNQEEKP